MHGGKVIRDDDHDCKLVVGYLGESLYFDIVDKNKGTILYSTRVYDTDHEGIEELKDELVEVLDYNGFDLHWGYDLNYEQWHTINRRWPHRMEP